MMFSTFHLDVRQACRSQWKSPGFLIAAILSLALGLGVNLAVFTALRASHSPSRVWREPDRLILLGRWDTTFLNLGDRLPVSYPRYQLWRRSQTACVDTAAFTWRKMAVKAPQAQADPFSIRALRVTDNFFQLLGVRPLLGRTLQSGDRDVVVLPFDLWQRRFGGNPAVLGQTLQMDDRPCVIVGVLPQAFRWVNAELFLPLVPSAEEAAEFGANSMMVLGRLKPGVELPQAAALLRQTSEQLRASFSTTEASITMIPCPLAVWAGGAQDKGDRLILLVAGAVLALACLNVAGLLLGRALARGRELALRQALGASRASLFLPMLAEALVVAAPGLLLGLLFAGWAKDLLKGFVPLPFQGLLRLGGWEIAFGVGLALAVALCCAWVPTWLAPRLELAPLLGGLRATETPQRRRSRHVMLSAQIALALAMLSGFFLLQASLAQLRHSPVGFNREQCLTATLRPPMRSEEDALRVSAQTGALLDRLRSLPGVKAAGVVNLLPVIDGGWNGDVGIPGRTEPAFANKRAISDGYFQAVGAALLKGRDFNASDLDSPMSDSVIVSESFARDYFPGREPLGAVLNEDGRARRIVGVVGDIRIDALTQTRDLQTLYMPHRASDPGINVILRTTGDPMALASRLRFEIGQAWPTVPLDHLDSMKNRLDGAIEDDRHQALLVGILALLALSLTLAGIFSVLSRNVMEQRREFGVRISFGATTRDILKQVVGQGLRITLIGVALGLAMSLACAKLLEGLLYGVKPFSPAHHLAAAAGLAVASLLACLIPAWRATQTDPAVVLRGE